MSKVNKIYSVTDKRGRTLTLEAFPKAPLLRISHGANDARCVVLDVEETDNLINALSEWADEWDET